MWLSKWINEINKKYDDCSDDNNNDDNNGNNKM